MKVLNAFRHHGLSRPKLAQPDLQLVWCSTPFGITVYLGTELEEIF